MSSLFIGVTQFHQQTFDDLPLPDRPIPGLAQLRLGRLGLGQRRAFFQAHAIIAKVGQEPVANLGGAFDRLAMAVEPVAPLLVLGSGTRRFGRAGQIGLADAHGADFVVVGVSFLELAHLATLQHECLPVHGGQGAHDLKAVAGGFQHKQIGGVRVLFGPLGQLRQRQMVEESFR